MYTTLISTALFSFLAARAVHAEFSVQTPSKFIQVPRFDHLSLLTFFSQVGETTGHSVTRLCFRGNRPKALTASFSSMRPIRAVKKCERYH